jgi:hypothetical protein
MALVIVIALLIALGAAAALFGRDSRDSRDWTSRPA